MVLGILLYEAVELAYNTIKLSYNSIHGIYNWYYQVESDNRLAHTDAIIEHTDTQLLIRTIESLTNKLTELEDKFDTNMGKSSNLICDDDVTYKKNIEIEELD